MQAAKIEKLTGKIMMLLGRGPWERPMTNQQVGEAEIEIREILDYEFMLAESKFWQRIDREKLVAKYAEPEFWRNVMGYNDSEREENSSDEEINDERN